MPQVTRARPAHTFQTSGSPRKIAADTADSPGTRAVIMVERTGPKCWIIFVKPMPDTTTEPTPWKAIWKAMSFQGATSLYLLDREGMAALVGVARTRAAASRMVGQAVHHLRLFGRRADPLRELATSIVWRTA